MVSTLCACCPNLPGPINDRRWACSRGEHRRRRPMSVRGRPFPGSASLNSSIHAACRCGHCKKLHPVMTQVGEHFASDASVQIVQMDFTANELSDKSYAVKGYPTLYLRQATGALVPYSGDRSMADLIKFVEDNKTVGKKEHDEL